MGRIVDIAEVLLELGLSSSATDEERAVANSAISRAEGAVIRFLRYDPVRLSRTEFFPQQGRAFQVGAGTWEVTDTHAVFSEDSLTNSNELQLRHVPIRSIDSLYVDYDARSGTASGAFAASTLKEEGVDFWPNYDMLDSAGAKICSDGILRGLGAWPANPGTVKVTYTAGYTTAEFHGQDTIINASSILEVVLDEAVRRTRKMFALKKRSGAGFVAGVLSSESLGDYSYSVDGASVRQLMTEGDLTQGSKEKLYDFVNLGWCLSG